MSDDNKTTRKLKAILSADVKGYSLLMADDEVFTIRTLKEYRQIIADTIQRHSGRVVDNPGDNILAEFGSAVDAVECAVRIQHRLKKENSNFVENRRLWFRIGINIGDIVQDGDRIYGEGVNVAARIESLADAGGICISRNTYDHVKAKLDYSFEYLGEQEVKNIKEPVRVYKVSIDGESRKPLVGEQLELPEKPSIAVLPFDNMSGDPSQEYFSDGLTEQIITGISKVPGFFVIARNSTFSYKGKAINVQQVAQEMGVRYVLEGSVQKAGDRVRINTQLIDAKTGHHLWAESYDRVLEDIFAIQDDISLNLIETLRVKLIPGTKYHHFEGRTKNVNAYIKLLQGTEYLYRETSVDNIKARKCYEEAIAMEQNYSLAFAGLALTHFFDVLYGWSQSPLKSFEQAEQNAVKTISLDDSLALPYSVLSTIYLVKRQHDKAIEHGEQAVALNPNSAVNHTMFANVLFYNDLIDKATRMMDIAHRLDPVPPYIYYLILGNIYRKQEKYTEAIGGYKKAHNLSPTTIFPHTGLAVCYIATGNDKEARNEVSEVLRLDPNFSLDRFRMAAPHKDQSYTEKVVNLLRKAGFK